MTTAQPQTNPDNYPVKILFIIDNEVVDVLHTDNRMGAILLSEPLILDVSEENFTEKNIHVGAIYDPKTGTFSTKGE